MYTQTQWLLILRLALNQLPSGAQLQHVHQIGESLIRSVPLVTDVSTQPNRQESGALPPVMLSSCLPPVPVKLVRRIEDGLFIEMGELSPNQLDSSDHLTSDLPASSRKIREVTSIIEWVQCFSVFIALSARAHTGPFGISKSHNTNIPAVSGRSMDSLRPPLSPKGIRPETSPVVNN